MNLLTICGSLRKGSFNQMLLSEAARHFAPSSTQTGDLDLPLYNGDVEAQGIPANVQTLANQIAQADAVVIASPEYNQGISGVLKNALDWVSRVEGKPWANKPVAIVHAAAGRTGGARANYALRLVLAPFDVNLIQSPEVLVAGAHGAFDKDGQLQDARYADNLSLLMERLRTAAKQHS